jgi:hypothetical protein
MNYGLTGLFRLKEGVIYMVQSKCHKRFVKLGHTTLDPWDRLRTLQTGCPIELELVCLWSADIHTEKHLISHMSDFNIRGEWFHYQEDIIQIIDEYLKDFKAEKIPPQRYNQLINNKIYSERAIDLGLTQAGKKYFKRYENAEIVS